VAGEAVAELLVGLGQHRVRGLAHDGVAEHVLVVAREPRPRRARDQLACDELVEPRTGTVAARRAAEQRGDAAAPELLAEHARRAQHAAGIDLEPLEATLDA